MVSSWHLVLLELALPPRWSSIFGSTAVTGMARHPRVYASDIKGNHGNPIATVIAWLSPGEMSMMYLSLSKTFIRGKNQKILLAYHHK